MKTMLRPFLLAVALGAGFTAFQPQPARAGDEHHHVVTPKGGRALDRTDPVAEVVINPDRTVAVHFYSRDLKPVAATQQKVTVIAEAKAGKTTLQFEKKGDALVSTSKLPDGDGYTVVVQFRPTADAKPQNTRFKLQLEACGECKRAEYACTCDH